MDTEGCLQGAPTTTERTFRTRKRLRDLLFELVVKLAVAM